MGGLGQARPGLIRENPDKPGPGSLKPSLPGPLVIPGEAPSGCQSALMGSNTSQSKGSDCVIIVWIKMN